jgi:hypothetical protein
MVSAETREVIRRGQEIYERDLRAKLEPTNLHDFVAVEPESGDHYLGSTLSEAIESARAAHPDRLCFAIRVGHGAAVHMGVLTP